MQFYLNTEVTFMYISYDHYLSPLYILVNCTIVWVLVFEKVKSTDFLTRLSVEILVQSLIDNGQV